MQKSGIASGDGDPKPEPRAVPGSTMLSGKAGWLPAVLGGCLGHDNSANLAACKRGGCTSPDPGSQGPRCLLRSCLGASLLGMGMAAFPSVFTWSSLCELVSHSPDENSVMPDERGLMVKCFLYKQ